MAMREQSVRMRYTLGPFVVLTFIYFVVGFLTTVNGQFQGPMKVAFLSHASELRNTLTTMISFFFFLGYLVNSGLGGRWIDRVGYKSTLLRALAIMTWGLLSTACRRGLWRDGADHMSGWGATSCPGDISYSWQGRS